ncbi:MAG: hypothetical protein PUI48_07275 [Oscillospiraceae bacterium]|nr:hypothetical protein [Oscillospiraceae bacterium]MDY6208011.1 hypothetical protein [Oscillospiraceae bacterium]
MFDLCSSLLAHEPPYCVSLRCCECGEDHLVDTDKFQTISHDFVVLKDNVKLSCERCGSTQPQDERYIPLEPQIIREEYLPSTESKLPYWMERDVTTEELLRAIVFD